MVSIGSSLLHIIFHIIFHNQGRGGIVRTRRSMPWAMVNPTAKDSEHVGIVRRKAREAEVLNAMTATAWTNRANGTTFKIDSSK